MVDERLKKPDMEKYRAIHDTPYSQKKAELLAAGWILHKSERSPDDPFSNLEFWSPPGEEDGTGYGTYPAYSSLKYREDKAARKQAMEDYKLDIFCNKCGEPVWKEDKHDNETHRVGYYGLANARVTGGYYSDDLSDCVAYKFSICEKCLAEFFLSCKMPVEQELYM